MTKYLFWCHRVVKNLVLKLVLNKSLPCWCGKMFDNKKGSHFSKAIGPGESLQNKKGWILLKVGGSNGQVGLIKCDWLMLQNQEVGVIK